MDFTLSGQAVRRLLRSVLVTVTHERPLTPVRAGIYQALATQLGVDFQMMAELSQNPSFEKPASRAEADATFLAALVVGSRDQPTMAEKQALAGLASFLELGVAVRELERLASQPTALTMIRLDTSAAPAAALPAPAPPAPLPAFPAASRAAQTPAPLPAFPAGTPPKPVAAPQGVVVVSAAAPPAPPSSSFAIKAPAPLKRALSKSRSGELLPVKRRMGSGERKGIGKPRSGDRHLVARRSGETRVRRHKRSGLPVWLIPVIATAAILLVLGGVYVMSDKQGGGSANPADDGTLTTRYNALVQSWNELNASGRRIPFASIDHVRTTARALSEEAEASTDGAERALGGKLEDLLRNELDDRWRVGARRLKLEIEDKVEAALQDDRFALALAHLDKLSSDFLAEEASWAAEQRALVEDCHGYSDRVGAFLKDHDEADELSEVEAGYELWLQADTERMTESFDRLEVWLERCDEHAAACFEQAVEAQGEGHDRAAKRALGMLLRIRPGDSLRRFLDAQSREILEGELEKQEQAVALTRLATQVSELAQLERDIEELVDGFAYDMRIEVAHIEQSLYADAEQEREQEEAERERAEQEEFFRALEDEFRRAEAERFELIKDHVFGTGFFIDSHHLLTNYHVVEGMQNLIGPMNELRVLTSDGELIGRIVSSDPELDVCLIEVEASGKPLKLCLGSVEEGRKVYTYGYGDLGDMSSTLVLTDGLISAVREEREIVSNISVNPGNSGGPLVDGSGRWLGVVRAKSRVTSRVDSRGFIIHGAAVRDWLLDQNIDVLTDDRASQDELDVDGVRNLRASVVGLKLPEGAEIQ